jgi:predicted MPP superfamily phosphohydrolase
MKEVLPRRCLAPARAPASARRVATATPIREVLGRAATAHERRRLLFRPGHGPWRSLERAISNYLSAEIYPRVPGLSRIYDRQLSRRLSLSEADVELSGLPEAFDGLRILVLTDLHAGPFVSPGALALAIERVLALGPDLVLVGGDLLTSRLREFDSHRAAFALLRAPLGAFAVLGNHDHYAGPAEQVIERLESIGLRVLHNRSVAIERDGARLWIAGVDDVLVGRPDLEAALAGCTPPLLLLSHNPDVFFEAARRGVALTLAGHTHGGQIRVPGLPVLVRQSRFRLDEGRYHAGPAQLVVSRGMGAVGLPWRVACPPEAVLLRLRAGA